VPYCFGKISVFFGSSNNILKLSSAFIRSLAGTLSFKNKYKCNPPLLEKHGTMDNLNFLLDHLYNLISLSSPLNFYILHHQHL